MNIERKRTIYDLISFTVGVFVADWTLHLVFDKPYMMNSWADLFFFVVFFCASVVFWGWWDRRNDNRGEKLEK